MRVIVAGSRSITDAKLVASAIANSAFEVTQVLCGMALGVDLLGREWAVARGIPVADYPADWTQGKRAGFVRNRQMAENADALVAVWDGRSRGTLNMIQEARARNLRVFVQGCVAGEFETSQLRPLVLIRTRPRVSRP